MSTQRCLPERVRTSFQTTLPALVRPRYKRVPISEQALKLVLGFVRKAPAITLEFEANGIARWLFRQSLLFITH